ncbi:MAG TPA: tetratricopeptide repeat protein [Longimicrobiaceae bacterium]|nr:tetratricopeptide repeat protein [Longimicrobiaceae bacterium]
MAQRRPGRPSPAPPALLRIFEPFTGAYVLDEVRSPLGVVLWQSVHDVVLWSSTPLDRRGALWSPAAAEVRARHLREVEMEDQLRGWLRVVARILEGSGPAEADEVAGACRRISDWAEGRGLPQTAIWYAQAVALLAPTVAEHACTVGALCRRASEYTRAMTWYSRSIGLARRRADRRTYARAYRGIGQILMYQGSYDAAEQAFDRAFKSARRAGIRDVAAQALHDLFTVAVETGRTAEAEELARRTFSAYPSAHPRLPALAHDVAVFWMLNGSPARALPVLQAVLPTLRDLSDRLYTISGIARAAGAVGDQVTFLSAWTETWGIIDANPHLECVTSSLICLALGSAALDDRERVEVAAGYALQLATARGQEQVANDARALLKGESPPRADVLPQADPVADLLATRIVQRIRTRHSRV